MLFSPLLRLLRLFAAECFPPLIRLLRLFAAILARTQALRLSCRPCRLRLPKRSSPAGLPPALPNAPTASPSYAGFVTSWG
jgi:hypothetical protein